jgi:serine protease AprX
MFDALKYLLFGVAPLLLVISGNFLPALGAQPPASSKVDSRVWEDVANGGTAHFLILLNEQTDAKTIGKQKADRQAKRRSVTANLRETAGHSQTNVLHLLQQQAAKHRSYWVVNMIAAEGNRGLVEALARRDDVRLIESDRSFRAQLAQPKAVSVTAGIEATTAVQPNLARIKATNIWRLGFTGQGIVYANADTGVLWDHPALKAHYRGWNGMSADHNYSWWDAIHNDIDGNGANPVGFNSRSPVDDNGHGTHTMGIGVGDDGAGSQIGVAPGAKFICCRNMDEGVGRPSTYIECMQFFLAPTDLNGNNPDPDRGADTVGNSYGCPADELCAPNTLHVMLENLRAAGIFMSVAAGNSGPDCSTVSDPPALDSASITVGATDNSDNIAYFSSRGPVAVDGSFRRKPDLVAPGIGVVSAWNDGGYAIADGTSMAAPHVAGAVALLWSAFPHIRGNVDYTQALLQQTAVHLTSVQLCGTNVGTPNNVFGYGRIDLLTAYNAVNKPPIASNTTVSIPGDFLASLTLRASDPEAAALTYEIVQPPTNGLISNFNTAIGMCNYTPTHAFMGNDRVVFRVSDGTFSSSNGVVQIAVLPPPDFDHDGIPDYWESSHLLSSTSSADAVFDPDKDLATSFQEYIANTDPQSSNSVFRITSMIRDTNGHNLLLWNSVGGTRYRIQWVDRTGAGAWNFADFVRPIADEMDPHAIGVPGMMSFLDDFVLTGVPPAGIARYYRIRVVR